MYQRNQGASSLWASGCGWEKIMAEVWPEVKSSLPELMGLACPQGRRARHWGRGGSEERSKGLWRGRNGSDLWHRRAVAAQNRWAVFQGHFLCTGDTRAVASQSHHCESVPIPVPWKCHSLDGSHEPIENRNSCSHLLSGLTTGEEEAGF